MTVTHFQCESQAVWQGAKRTDTVSQVCAKRPSFFANCDEVAPSLEAEEMAQQSPHDFDRAWLLDAIGYLRIAKRHSAIALYQGADIQPVFSAAVRALSDDCRKHLNDAGGMAGEW